MIAESIDLAMVGLLQALKMDEQKRVAEMERAWAYYRGEQPDQVGRNKDGSDDNVTINLCRLAVDASRRALLGDAFGWAIPQDDVAAEPQDDPAQQALDAFVEPNRLNLTKLVLNGGVCGHAWYLLIPRPGEQPRLMVIPPMLVTYKLDPNDAERIYVYRITWSTLDANGKPIDRRKTIGQPLDDPQGSWTIVDEERRQQNVWVQIASALWGFSWPPIGECQNLPNPNETWGLPDITPDVLALQDAINRSASNIGKILRYHAHPMLYASGMGESSLNVGPDEMLLLPDPASKVGTVEMTNDLSSSRDYWHDLDDAFHKTTRVPQVAAGKLEDAGQLSGVALSILYGPLVALTDDKRSTYGPMLSELGRRVLELQGLEVVTPENVWPDVVPNDMAAEVALLEADHRLGASKRTLLQKRGYDPDHELKQSGQEADEAAERQARQFDAGGFGQNGGGGGNEG